MTTDARRTIITPDRKRTPVKFTADGRTLMVTDLLEKKGYARVIRRQLPFWNPPVPAPARRLMGEAHVPNVSWVREGIRAGAPLTDVDANAAFLSAASSATFAHGALEHTGPWDDEAPIKPGYYLVEPYAWQGETPGSPLGAQRLDGGRIWVTHKTYRLLRDLCHGSTWCEPGLWPDATAYDSWTCESTMRLTMWTDVLRDMRSMFISEGDREAYEALKLGYSQTFQMWITKPDPKGTPREKQQKHNAAYRPDWYHTLRSQWSANLWRAAYRSALAGHPPVQVGGRGHVTDGMCYRTADLTAVLAKGIIKLDATGRDLGTYKMTIRHTSGDGAE